MKLNKTLITLLISCALAYASFLSATEEPSDYYNNLLDKAILLDKEEGNIEQALKIYNQVINNSQAPTNLRMEASFNKAIMLYVLNQGSANLAEILPQIIELSQNVIKQEITQDNADFWTKTHLLLAKIDLDHYTLDNDISKIKSALKHYSQILSRKSSFNIDPKTILIAAIGYSNLANTFSEQLGVAINTRVASQIMLNAYNMIPQDEKDDPENASLIIDYIDAMRHTLLITNLDIAQKILNVPFIEQEDLTYARYLLNGIITNPENQRFPKIKNRARLILAGMNLRGEGLPGNIPDIPAAKKLYGTVQIQLDSHLMQGDKAKANLALNLMNRKEKRKAE